MLLPPDLSGGFPFIAYAPRSESISSSLCISPHASSALSADASSTDVYTAQHILGHANVSTTLEIYTDLRRTHERKNVGKFARSMAKLQTAAKKGKKKPRAEPLGF